MAKDWKAALVRKKQAREKAEAVADARQADLYAAMLDVFDSDAGNYDDIAEVVGLSRIRVGQILRLERERRGMEPNRCAGFVKAGTPCPAVTRHESGYCWSHRVMAEV